jgi:methionyl-tRNA formyltransferase
VTRAVVFAYHDVGVRCLRVLLEHGVVVPLVVTHADAPDEHIWFSSVAQHARWHGLKVTTPTEPNAPEFVERVRSAQPDFLFSFYYRELLGAALLATAPRGAYNMHGSLLPMYRGRAPVNWAVLRGERETGATLHAMTVQADAGGIVDAQAVPILGDDTAIEVFRKVTVAAELTLARAWPKSVWWTNSTGVVVPSMSRRTAPTFFSSTRPGGESMRDPCRAADNPGRRRSPCSGASNPIYPGRAGWPGCPGRRTDRTNATCRAAPGSSHPLLPRSR